MIQASIDSVLHKALVDDSASSSARGYDAVAFVDMAGNMQIPDYSLTPFRFQASSAVSFAMLYNYNNANLQSLAIQTDHVYASQVLLYTNDTPTWKQLLAGRSTVFSNGIRFTTCDIRDDVIPKLHCNAWKKFLELTAQAEQFVADLEHEWGAYSDDNVMYQQWFKHNVECLQYHLSVFPTLHRLGESESHDNRVMFITSIAYVMAALGARGVKRADMHWADIQEDPRDKTNSLVKSVYALCAENAVHTKGAMLPMSISLWDEEQSCEREFTSFAGFNVSACDYRDVWSSNRLTAYPPDLDTGMRVLGYYSILDEIESEKQKLLAEEQDVIELNLTGLIAEYRRTFELGVQRLMMNALTSMASKLLSLEQRMGAAGTIMTGAPLW